MARAVLFLCTGNLYRSRFAEHLFNHRSAQESLNWHAVSCGIATELNRANIGPISAYTVQGLRQIGIELNPEPRYPIQLQEQDLVQADVVVALYRVEHRPLLQARFPNWVDRGDYWDVADLNILSAEDAWQLMAREVESLIQRLANFKNDGKLNKKMDP